MNIEVNVKDATRSGQARGDNSLPCCKQAWCDISETAALIVLILNCLSPGWGTFIAGIIDKQGLNVNALVTGFIQFLLSPFIIGWIWSILHGWRQYQGSKGK